MLISHQNVSTLHCFSSLWGESLGNFLWKMNVLWTPPFQNSFFQNRLAHLHTNFELDRTSRFREKWHFLLEIDHFEKCKSDQLSWHWRLPESNGRYQSIRRTLYCKKVLFLRFHLFYFLKNDPFFHEKVSKSCFKNCPFSRKLRDFCYSLL